jgi:DNA ligase (NAD+)
LRSLLRFNAYDLITVNNDDKDDLILSSGLEARQLLEEWGFQVPQPMLVTELQLPIQPSPSKTTTTTNNYIPPEETNGDASWSAADIQPMLEYYHELQQHRLKVQLLHQDENNNNNNNNNNKFSWGDYDMDGCVHKLSNHELRTLLGASNKSPRWAVAHKFPPQMAVTKLIGLEIQVGRTGALTPVAILEPVDLQGVTVQRATLHNFGHLRHVLLLGCDDDKNVTKLASGTLVMVRRAGEVIPQVVRRVDTSNAMIPTLSSDDDISVEPPTHCPACGSPTIVEESAKSSSNNTATIGQVLRCGGPPLLCPPRAVTSLAHAYSRDALDITGFSEARIQQLMDANLLQFQCDVFLWSNEKWEEIAALPGWGPRSSANLRETARRVSTNGVSLGRYIYSLGIRHTGKHSSEILGSAFGTCEAFLQALERASGWEEDTEEDTNNKQIHPFALLLGEEHKGIGPALQSSLLAFSKEKEMLAAARKLAEAILVQDEQPRNADEADSTLSSIKPLQGLKVVFTGTFAELTRSEVQKMAKELGASATPGSVSKATDLVVYGDKGGKKLYQAIELGVKVIEAQEFIKMVEESRID